MPEPERPPAERDDDVMDGTRALVRKVAAALLLASTVAVFGFWWLRVRAPGPEEVCAHKIQLVLDTTAPEQREGADALISKLELRCVEAGYRKIKLRGKLVWAEYAKCVTAASTLMDAERC